MSEQLSMFPCNKTAAIATTRIAVSIIIPCYNAARWITESIASAASQQGLRCEIVIIDDGSTDGSPDIASTSIATLADAVVLREPHQGVSHARNIGTRLARGAFLQYLDADDLLEPDTMAQRVHALERARKGIAYCDWRLWERQWDGSFGPGAMICRALGERPDVELLSDAWWPPGAVLYRREVVQRVGQWNENLTVTQDVNFMVKAASRGFRFARVENVGLRYRLLESSLSRRDPGLFLLDACRSAFDIEDFWSVDNRLDSLRKTALARLYRYLSRAISDAQVSRELAKRMTLLESV